MSWVKAAAWVVLGIDVAIVTWNLAITITTKAVAKAMEPDEAELEQQALDKVAGNKLSDDFYQQLKKRIKDIDVDVTCPHEGCFDRGPVFSTVMCLNDEHRWSRERIADWLDTLEDLDLEVHQDPLPEPERPVQPKPKYPSAVYRQADSAWQAVMDNSKHSGDSPCPACEAADAARQAVFDAYDAGELTETPKKEMTS